MSDEPTPSIHEANKVVRVLAGRTLKYTCRIHKPDGSIIEFQCEDVPQLDYNNEARGLWIKLGGYGGTPICAHELGMVILCETNEKP